MYSAAPRQMPSVPADPPLLAVADACTATLAPDIGARESRGSVISYRISRVNCIDQFVSQVAPSSNEKAWSQRADAAAWFVQSCRTMMC